MMFTEVAPPTLELVQTLWNADAMSSTAAAPDYFEGEPNHERNE